MINMATDNQTAIARSDRFTRTVSCQPLTVRVLRSGKRLQSFHQKAFHTASVLDRKGCMACVKLFTIAAVAFVCIAAENSAQLPVTFVSPCECRDNHSKACLAGKEDPSMPPAETSAIQAVTPSDIFSWPAARDCYRQRTLED